MGLTSEEQKAVEAFRTRVVDPSMTSLVVLDFWAEWCGPCKQLTPVIESVCAEYADRGVVLAKVNVDEESFIASQFQVRSIPTVYAMFQGRPVADLTAARTEPQLRAMLDQLLAKLPPLGAAGAAALDLAPLLEEGEALLAAGEAEQAHLLFGDVLGEDPDNVVALAGMARALTTLGRAQEAAALLDSLTPEQAADPAVARARAALAIASAARDDSEVEALEATVAANPDDHHSRFELANALMAAGMRDRAADALLHIVAADRQWNDGAARTRLLAIFEAVGLEDPWVAAQRRRLSAVLFG